MDNAFSNLAMEIRALPRAPRKVQRVRDPLHNLIEFADEDLDQTCWKALATRPLQRLRRIKQLGFSDYVYPGACHSRLAHSIGVFHTARQLDRIISDRLGGHKGTYENRKGQVAVAAALIHDIGHGPFSHAFEHALDAANLSRKHETRTQALIQNTELKDVFDEGFGAEFADQVAKIILSKQPADIYASIVSSQFDADRLDYVRRDRLMSGTQQSAIDFEWLLRNLEVRKVQRGVDDVNLGKVETLVLNSKATIAAEGYALSLFYLYINVVLHKTTRGYEKLFTALMERVARLVLDDSIDHAGLPANHPIVTYLANPDSVDAFLRLDDSVIYGALSLFEDSRDPATSELATRIRDRRGYSCIDVSKVMSARFETPEESDSEKRAAARQLARVKTAEATELIKSRGLVAYTDGQVPPILQDERAKREAYKQQGNLSSIYLVGHDDQLHDLANISPVVEALGEFQAYRLYVRDQEATELVNSVLGEIK